MVEERVDGLECPASDCETCSKTARNEWAVCQAIREHRPEAKEVEVAEDRVWVACGDEDFLVDVLASDVPEGGSEMKSKVMTGAEFEVAYEEDIHSRREAWENSVPTVEHGPRIEMNPDHPDYRPEQHGKGEVEVEEDRVWVKCGDEAFMVDVLVSDVSAGERDLLDIVVSKGKLAKYIKRVNELLRWQPRAKLGIGCYQREIAKLIW